MDLSYSPEELAFRNEVRSWLAANLPDDIRDKVVGYQQLGKDDIIRWHKILAVKGWSVPHWPVDWGGTGWNITQRYIYRRRIRPGRCAGPGHRLARQMCASVLHAFWLARAEKSRFLPRIREGDDFWVQGYSEPGAGSDLAALKMQKQNGRVTITCVNGQKIWTTLGHYGDWIFCLVRTDARRPRSARKASAFC